jgi:3-dehydrosphinganine reductase
MKENLAGKTAFITGGAGGLGRALAKELASRGAHITLFSRTHDPLEEARDEIFPFRLNKTQDVSCVTVDMGYAHKVDEAFKSQPRVPDIVYCVAGGNYNQNGFFVDLSAKDLEDCMRNNYFSAANAAKSLMDIWLAEDAVSLKPPRQKHRQLIFINSAAAFLGLPGSVAYTTSKAAVRALADTLRLEVLRHDTAESHYSIHCAFPGDFVSPGFMKEQETKVHLNKTIQGLHQPIEKLVAKFPSSEKVASMIIKAVDRGDFIVTYSLEQHALFANMMGASPKRGWGIVDTLLQPLMSWFVMPYFRRKWECITKKDGEQLRLLRD